MTVAELQSRVGALPDLDAILAALAEGGRVDSEEHRAALGALRQRRRAGAGGGRGTISPRPGARSPGARWSTTWPRWAGRPPRPRSRRRSSARRPWCGGSSRSACCASSPRSSASPSTATCWARAGQAPPRSSCARDQALALDRLTGASSRPARVRAAPAPGDDRLRQDRGLSAGRRGGARRAAASAILLVPEIALVPALARAVERRFGEQLAILHSGLGVGERHQEWERVRRGEARVVLGPRSALFAPVADLGLIVVDEEQDSSYKQELVAALQRPRPRAGPRAGTPAPRPCSSPPRRASRAATTPSAASSSCCA